MLTYYGRSDMFPFVIHCCQLVFYREIEGSHLPRSYWRLLEYLVILCSYCSHRIGLKLCIICEILFYQFLVYYELQPIFVHYLETYSSCSMKNSIKLNATDPKFYSPFIFPTRFKTMHNLVLVRAGIMEWVQKNKFRAAIWYLGDFLYPILQVRVEYPFQP